MKLKPRTEPLKAMRVAVSLPGTLHADLSRYCAFYAEQYGESISSAELILEMLRSFMDSDASFRTWKRTHSASQAPPSARTSEDELSTRRRTHT